MKTGDLEGKRRRKKGRRRKRNKKGGGEIGGDRKGRALAAQ